MPVCALIDKEIVHHFPQKMFDATSLSQFIESQDGHSHKQTVPYPVNDILIFFEYWKKEALSDDRIVNPVIEYVGTTYPRFYDSYLSGLIGTQLGVKTAGRNVILLIYVPIVLTSLFILSLILRLLRKLCCPKKKKSQ